LETAFRDLVLLGMIVPVTLSWRIWWYGRAQYHLALQVGLSALTGFAIFALGFAATVITIRAI
jgi:hypothetical protein